MVVHVPGSLAPCASEAGPGPFLTPPRISMTVDEYGGYAMGDRR